MSKCLSFVILINYLDISCMLFCEQLLSRVLTVRTLCGLILRKFINNIRTNKRKKCYVNFTTSLIIIKEKRRLLHAYVRVACLWYSNNYELSHRHIALQMNNDNNIFFYILAVISSLIFFLLQEYSFSLYFICTSLILY